MIRTNDHRSRGFTLSELLVATAIFTIIIVAALLMYDRNQQVFKQSSEAADLQQNTRVAFNKLVGDVRMAGFDFDRDGIPQLAGQAQAPDEQLEYANTSALTIRGNFDYDAAEAGDHDNGREEALESAKFPVVTTGNNEIVTYALKSKTGPNTDKVAIKIDISGVPRDGNEETYEIDQIDLTNANPPYELQRIRFLEDKSIERTTIADNVRSLKFQYFRDPTGLSNEVTTMPLGTDANRDVRAGIRAIRVELIGMNAAKDAAYTNPEETSTAVTAAKNYRTYKLESLIVPRNLGLRGMVEPEIEPPQAPTVKGVCIGACGFAYVTWDPPAAGAPVNSYSITWDESSAGSFNNLTALGNVTGGWAGPMDPAKKYFFKVKSLNGYGSNASTVFPGSGSGIQPINKTKSSPPVLATAAGAATGNEITVTWPSPTTNVSGAYGNYGGSASCTSPPSAANLASKEEITGYRVYRSTTTGFTPNAGNLVWQGRFADAGTKIERADDGTVTFHDTTAKLNCTPYFYRVQAVESCNALPAGTTDNDLAACVSDVSNELTAQSTAKAVPATPTGFTILPSSGCGGGGLCTVNLQWNAVSKDTSTPPEDIQIANYRIVRETWKNGIKLATTPIDVSWPSIAGPVTYTDSGPTLIKADALGNTFQYKYQVAALQPCTPESISAYSTQQTFPCANFTVNPPATGVMSGDGSSSNPYMITGPVGTFNVALTAAVTSVTYTLTNTSTGVTSAPANATKITNTSYNVDVPLSGNDGTVYNLVVTVSDTTNGCVTTNAPGTYITDSPNSSCCLRPYKLAGGTIFDPSSPILVLNAAANTITVKVENDCDDPLEITAMTFSFEDGGNKKWGIKKIVYTTPGGGDQQDFGGTTFKNSPLTMTTSSTHKLPADVSKRTIPANFNSQSYQMVLTMESSQNNPPALTLDDLTGVCITYKDALGTTVQCRIAQQVSSNATCSP